MTRPLSSSCAFQSVYGASISEMPGVAVREAERLQRLGHHAVLVPGDLQREREHEHVA